MSAVKNVPWVFSALTLLQSFLMQHHPSRWQNMSIGKSHLTEMKNDLVIQFDGVR